MRRHILYVLVQFVAMVSFGQAYHLGDLYTAPDGSQGIVFHVNADGGGWAVALHNAADSVPWSTIEDNIPSLPDHSDIFAAFSDTSGYLNTLAIRNFVGTGNLYAAGVVDFDNGWYLPSLGQLGLIYAQLPVIQSALTAAGGSPIDTYAPPYYNYYDNFWSFSAYWSSTESNVTMGSNVSVAWVFHFADDTDYPIYWTQYSGIPIVGAKTQLFLRVRAVRSFPPPQNTYDTTLTYLWNTGSTEPHFADVPLQTTTYTVTVTSTYGCTNSASTNVMVLDNGPQTLYDTACQGAAYSNYGFTLTEEETAGIEEVVLTRTAAAAGCESEITLHLTLLAPDVVEIEHQGGQSYSWNGITYTEDGVYTQYFNNRFGCDSTVTLTLTLDSSPGPGPDTTAAEETASNVLYLPNAFTPNDDSKNTIFLPVFTNPDEIENYSMEIYNRWGALVFRTEEITFGWDGANALEGVYAVVVHYTSRGAKPKTMTGSVTLIR